MLKSHTHFLSTFATICFVSFCFFFFTKRNPCLLQLRYVISQMLISKAVKVAQPHQPAPFYNVFIPLFSKYFQSAFLYFSYSLLLRCNLQRYSWLGESLGGWNKAVVVIAGFIYLLLSAAIQYIYNSPTLHFKRETIRHSAHALFLPPLLPGLSKAISSGMQCKLALSNKHFWAVAVVEAILYWKHSTINSPKLFAQALCKNITR